MEAYSKALVGIIVRKMLQKNTGHQTLYPDISHLLLPQGICQCSIASLIKEAFSLYSYRQSAPELESCRESVGLGVCEDVYAIRERRHGLPGQSLAFSLSGCQVVIGYRDGRAHT